MIETSEIFRRRAVVWNITAHYCGEGTTWDSNILWSHFKMNTAQFETLRDRVSPAREFRLFDDDGEHMATGYILTEESGTELDFIPLDDWGTPEMGCTGIQYRNEKTGEWEYL